MISRAGNVRSKSPLALTDGDAESRIFDIHHHLGSLHVGIGEPSIDSISDTSPHETHIAMLDRFGFTAAAVQPSLQYERPHGIVDTRSVNDAVAAYRDRCPSRFPVALGTVEPLHGVGLSVKEIERVATELHLDGLTWHTRYQGVAINDRRMHRFVEKASEMGLPCFIHVFAESNLEAPWMLGELARDHPDALIVALDAFSGVTQISYIRDLADRYENLLFDTALSFPHMQPLDRFVQTFGSERLLFGTDAYADPVPYNTPTVLHELRASSMNKTDLENILWRNAERLFPVIREVVQEGVRVN